MTTDDPIEHLREAINSHDPQRIADCFTPDYRAETPHRPAESFVGSEHVVTNWRGILARIPDIEARVLRRAESRSELWSEWEMTGTGPSGVPTTLGGPAIMIIRDGRIAATRFYLAPIPAP